MKRVLTFIALVGLLVPTAQADFILKLNDFVNPEITIADGAALDSNPLAGAIDFIGSIGNWVASITTGRSKPVLGSVATPHMDLVSVNVTSAASGLLLIELTDTDFALPVEGANARLVSDISGTTSGTVLFDQYLDRLNNEFGYFDYVVSQGPFTPGAFSGTSFVATPVADGVAFSITERVLITHTTGSSVTTLNASSTVVPAPGAVLLGMLGLSATGLKLRRLI